MLLRKKVLTGVSQSAVLTTSEEKNKKHILYTLSGHTYITENTIVSVNSLTIFHQGQLR